MKQNKTHNVMGRSIRSVEDVPNNTAVYYDAKGNKIFDSDQHNIEDFRAILFLVGSRNKKGKSES